MAGETYLAVVGNLAADPEVKYTPNGTAVCRFTVASTPRYFDKQSNGWKDGEPLWQRCVAFGQMGENIADSLIKGARAVVWGVLQQRSWTTDDGQKRSVVELRVDDAGPSLRFTGAKVNRAERTSGREHDAWEAGGDDAPF